MKSKKNLVMLLSVGIGVILLVSTAVADSLSRTPYDQLKDAIKMTSETVTSGIDSYTMETTMALTDNDEVLMSESTVTKLDLKQGKDETSKTTQYGDFTASISYNYSDSEQSIYYDSASDTYYVSEYNTPEQDVIYGDGMINNYSSTNPFDDEAAADIEKIFDAFIGNLKNYVTVTKADDGSKEFSGSLSGAQIPALVNAVVSFASKQYFATSYYMTDYKQYSSNYMDPQSIVKPELPEITGEVLVKSVEGTLSVNADGMVTGFTVNGVVSGKDTAGIDHDIRIEANGILSNFNSTVVKAPDLTGKNVEVSKVDNSRNQTDMLLPVKFIGTYKNDIIVETTNSLDKVGERVLVIESIVNNEVSGHYYETYIDGYADIPQISNDFTFADQAPNPYDPYSLEITYTDATSAQHTAQLYFDTYSYKIQFWPMDGNIEKTRDNTFSRAFD